MTRKFRSNTGQAVIEMALLLPFVTILVVGLIEFGVLFYNKAVVTNASREGARAGMAFQTDISGDYWSESQMQANVQQTVTDYLQGRILAFGPRGTIAAQATRSGIVNVDGIDYFDLASNAIGTVEVEVAYQHAYLAIPNFLGWGDTINIGATTTMRLE